MTTPDQRNLAAFPAQPPPTNPRVARYIAEASAASRYVIRRTPPQRWSYGPSVSHKLDVIVAEDSAAVPALRPTLVFFHGGVWSNGYPWWTNACSPMSDRIELADHRCIQGIASAAQMQ